MAITTEATGVLLIPHAKGTMLYVVTPLDLYPELTALHAGTRT